MARSNRQGMGTRLIHGGEPKERVFGAAVVPTFRGTVYEVATEMAWKDIPYPRLSNSPNHTVLHGKLASVSATEEALVTSSGMSAITTSLLALAGGGHILAQKTLYGGSHGALSAVLPRLGISSSRVDITKPETWKSALRSDTRVFYVETIANPLMEIGDLAAVVEFAKDHGLTPIVDNTFGSPINFRPSEWGFELEVHSATKYLNGHSDLVAGALMGTKEAVNRVRDLLNYLGGVLDPTLCAQLHRGMQTLEVRVQRQNDTALALASFLEAHPRVERVLYPGLESNASYARAQQYLDGAGGVLSVELHGEADTARRVVENLSIAINGPSLGGPETLVTRPATTSHASLSPKERLECGVSDRLIRISVGLEESQDIVEDWKNALGS